MVDGRCRLTAVLEATVLEAVLEATVEAVKQLHADC